MTTEKTKFNCCHITFAYSHSNKSFVLFGMAIASSVTVLCPYCKLQTVQLGQPLPLSLNRYNSVSSSCLHFLRKAVYSVLKMGFSSCSKSLVWVVTSQMIFTFPLLPLNFPDVVCQSFYLPLPLSNTLSPVPFVPFSYLKTSTRSHKK